MSAPPLAEKAVRLSVAMVTLNEEENLERTLESVAWADEIVVVDSGSSDRTVEIARGMGARVIERAWAGFAAQKNFAMELCTGEWVLSLDADEELTAELQRELQMLVAGGSSEFGAYRVKRRNLFLERWMKRGGFYPDAKLRLFRREFALRFGERAVHETIAFEGEAGTLRGDLLHHAYPTLAGYIEHMQRYSTLGAEVLVQRGRVSGGVVAFAWNVWLVPVLGFAWNYGARGGFLDGREGLLLHLYQAVYTSWKYAKAWERG